MVRFSLKGNNPSDIHLPAAKTFLHIGILGVGCIYTIMKVARETLPPLIQGNHGFQYQHQGNSIAKAVISTFSLCQLSNLKLKHEDSGFCANFMSLFQVEVRGDVITKGAWDPRVCPGPSPGVPHVWRDFGTSKFKAKDMAKG